jgi:hypothetical protein
MLTDRRGIEATMTEPPEPSAPEDEGGPEVAPDRGQTADGGMRGVTETDTSHVEWSALPDLGDEADHVEAVPDEEPPPDERQPPPETIWGAI